MSPGTMQLAGRLIRGTGRPSRRFPEGRVCAAHGCGTRLSVYNRARYCWAHRFEDATTPRPSAWS